MFGRRVPQSAANTRPTKIYAKKRKVPISVSMVPQWQSARKRRAAEPTNKSRVPRQNFGPAGLLNTLLVLMCLIGYGVKKLDHRRQHEHCIAPGTFL
jgi:hypothetical protein